MVVAGGLGGKVEGKASTDIGCSLLPLKWKVVWEEGRRDGDGPCTAASRRLRISVHLSTASIPR